MWRRCSSGDYEAASERQSLHFVHYQLATGRRFWGLNIVDDLTREYLRAVAATSISGESDPRTRRFDRRARSAVGDRLGQWHQADVERGAELVGRYPDRVALHRARPACRPMNERSLVSAE